MAAIIHQAAATHLTTDPTLLAQNQPDVLSLHIEFLRACERLESTVTVSVLKLGATACTLQLQLSQNGKIRVVALAISTNFDRPLGPTAPTGWTLLPPPEPKPDFDRVLANQPEDNWIPARVEGEIIPLTGRIFVLYPRTGLRSEGICDTWSSFIDDERMDATYIALMTDMIPDMAETILRKGGLYDARRYWHTASQWAEANPGSPAVLKTSMEEAKRASTFSNTVVLDMEFKRRLPKEGLRFVLIRTAARTLQDGRLDLDVTICDEEMEVVCKSHQLILVLEAQRKFRSDKKTEQKL